MANTYTTLDGLFTGIADAIRLKNGSTDIIVADTFPTEISNLRTGFDYNNHNVTVIEDYQFKNCTDLRSVDTPNVKTVGESTFQDCSNLKSIVLYNVVESVGENAFKDCDGLIILCKAIEKPDTWDENWNPDDRPVVWGYENLVETWDISKTENDNVIAKLYAINDGCYTLVIVGSGDMEDYDSDNQLWNSYESNLKYIIIDNSVKNISYYAFSGCTALTSITIPDSVTSIYNNAFNRCTSLTSVTIPDSVTSIGSNAFANCYSLTSINIPDSVTSIGSSAFSNCESLTSITIPDSVTSISQSAFYNTAYYNKSSNWTNKVLYIDNALIEAKTSISGDYMIKDGVTLIANYAFKDCTSLTSITIPDSVTSIGDDAFRRCTSLTSVTIPDSVTSIGYYAFAHCTSLTSITIPDSVTSIGGNAFSGCTSLTSITIPDSVTRIDSNAFYDCESLTSITIPDSVTSIGSGTFYNCKSLISINYTDTVAQWKAIKINNTWNYHTGNYTIHCTDGDIAKDGTITYHTSGGDN